MKRLKILGDFMNRPETLDERQILAAQSLAAGCTVRDAARRAKCTAESIRVWRKRSDFSDCIWHYQQELFQQSFGITSEALPMAIAKLTEIVETNDPDVPVSVKVSAIKILIDSAQKAYETRTIERRIDQLESYARTQSVIETQPIREITPGTP